MPTPLARGARRTWAIIRIIGWAIPIIGLPWLYFDSDPPIVISSSRTATPEVQRGGILRIEHRLARLRNCPGQVQRVIIDATEVVHFSQPYSFGSIADAQADGVERASAVEVGVPLGATPGPAEYRSYLVYGCNWFQRLLGTGISVEVPPLRFMILSSASTQSRAPTRNEGEPAPPASILPAPRVDFRMMDAMATEE